MISTRWCALALAAAVVGLGGSAAANHEPHNICETQIRDYVSSQLGQTVERIRFWWAYGGFRNEATDNHSYAVVYTTECPGFHGFDLVAQYEDCTLPHYGSAMNYVIYTGGEGGC